MQKRILLIDTDSKTRKETNSILGLAGYSVLPATDGKAGLEIALQEIPDLILCDLDMPGLDGSGVLHVLGKNPETAGIPFILQTEKHTPDIFRDGMNLGADDLLVKPADGTGLLRMIETRLRRHEMLLGMQMPANEEVEEFFRSDRPVREFEKLMEGRIRRVLRRKESLYMEGQTPNDVFFVRSGLVKTFRINSDGKELITGLHRDNSFIGTTPVLRMSPYTENAEVVTDAEVGFISRQDFLSLICTNHQAAARIIRMLTHQLHEAENRLVALAYDSVRQKVAHALLEVGRMTAEPEKPFRIARRDLSGLIGTATESLNRTLADFKDEGLISILPEGIQILNPVKLERMR